MKGNPWLDTRLAIQMAACSIASDRWALAKEVLESAGDSFQPELVTQLESALNDGSAPDNLPATANALLLAARLSSREGNQTTARAAWEAFFQKSNRPDAQDLLAYARVLSESDLATAAAALRRALETKPAYSFYPRAEKFLRGLQKRAPEKSLRTCRIAVLGSSTTALFLPVLRAILWRERIDAELYQGLYGSVDQEILDPASGLAAFKPDIVLILTQWRDLNLPAVTQDADATIASVTGRFAELWRVLGERFSCQVIQQSFDYPAAESLGILGQSLPGGRSQMIERINRALIEQAPAHVSILDTPSVQRAAAVWEDPMEWHNFQQHPSLEALPPLVEAHTAHIRAVLGLTRKVLITDLDNTLWQGVIGEDGLDGIGVGPGSPAGEAHAALQVYMRELKERGILLAVCSKNNLADAQLPFQQHSGMKLRLDDFAAFKANWQDKASNIRDLAEELSLGLDSFVFLDDSPLEREWVRSQLPQVAVIEPGESIAGYITALDRGRFFFSLKLSKEDLARAESYRVAVAREQLRATAVSVDEFLAQLQLKAKVSSVTPSNLARITQLINKTNQFNVTTRRYTEALVESTAAAPENWVAAFSLEDRLGSYGLIGVMIARSGGQTLWEIDTWLMSCRVLGRQMEKFMFDRLVEAAAARGIREIAGIYHPTEKNVLVRDLYPQFGFTAVENGQGGQRYTFSLPKRLEPTATHVLQV